MVASSNPPKVKRQSAAATKVSKPRQKKAKSARPSKAKSAVTLARLTRKLEDMVAKLEQGSPDEPVSDADVKMLGALIKSFEQISALRAKEQQSRDEAQGMDQNIDQLRRKLTQRLTRLSQRKADSS